MTLEPSCSAAQASAANDATAADFQQWCIRHAGRAESALMASLPKADVLPQRLHEGMRYAVLDGGKRIRPLLAYAAAELTGAPLAVADNAACAVEMIHAYSLVHDDLPCMDNDVMRRGKPTVHVAFGEATAMLVGDALQPLAFGLLAQAASAGARPQAVIEMVQVLAEAAGSLGMAGGQAIDLQAVGQAMSRDQLQGMHERKTGAMLRAAVLLGALGGRVLSQSEQLSLDCYARAIGLAFQVVDDILDVQADSATLGKTAGKDALNDKPTYVSVLGLQPSQAMAQQLCCEAHESLQPFANAARRLHELADLIVLRKS